MKERLGKMADQVGCLLASRKRVELNEERRYHTLDDITADKFFWIGHQDRVKADATYLTRLFGLLENLLTACS